MEYSDFFAGNSCDKLANSLIDSHMKVMKCSSVDSHLFFLSHSVIFYTIPYTHTFMHLLNDKAKPKTAYLHDLGLSDWTTNLRYQFTAFLPGIRNLKGTLGHSRWQEQRET